MGSSFIQNATIITIYVEPFKSIEQIKAIIEKDQNILVEQQALIYENQESLDERLLNYYVNIKDETTLHIVVKPKKLQFELEIKKMYNSMTFVNSLPKDRVAEVISQIEEMDQEISEEGMLVYHKGTKVLESDTLINLGIAS